MRTSSYLFLIFEPLDCCKLRKTKINQPNINSFLIARVKFIDKDNIVQLDISVHNVLMMKISQSSYQLSEDQFYDA